MSAVRDELLDLLNLKEEGSDPLEEDEAELKVEYEIQHKDTTPKNESEERWQDEDERSFFEDYTPVEQVPFTMMQHIKTTLIAEGREGQEVEVNSFVDTGSPCSFAGEKLLEKLGLQEKLTPVTEMFWGAITGKPKGRVSIKLKPKGASKWLEHDIFIAQHLGKKETDSFGEMITGIPLSMGMGLSIQMK